MLFDYIDAYAKAVLSEFEKTSSDPNTIIRSDDNNFYIEIDIPRVKKSEVEVIVNGDELNINVASSALKFKKVYRIADTISKDNITARVEDGVLYITLQRTKKATKVVKIE